MGIFQIYDDIKLEVGMKLEAVDKENRGNICVSTISKVVGRHIWLNIDGDTRSDQVFHVDSHDVFPVGWCEATGHELQWPRPNSRRSSVSLNYPASNMHYLHSTSSHLYYFCLNFPLGMHEVRPKTILAGEGIV